MLPGWLAFTVTLPGATMVAVLPLIVISDEVVANVTGSAELAVADNDLKSGDLIISIASYQTNFPMPNNTKIKIQ